MRAALSFLIAGVSFCIGTPANSQPPHPVGERIQFESTDTVDGRPVLLSGWWIKADGEGKRPTIIALHGCGGLFSSAPSRRHQFSARHAAMADILRGAGYHVLWPDSFTARGKRSICSEKFSERDIKVTHRRGDVLGAQAWLAMQTNVDTTRIALLGWSHGGSTVLSTVRATQNDRANQSLPLRAAIAFYPGCTAYAKQRPPYHSMAPLLILMGEKDDWTPPAPCVALAANVGAEGAPVRIRLFADSYHDFDAPMQPLRVRYDVPNGTRPGFGVTTGSNHEAREAAYREMLNFLTEQLK